MFGAIIGDIVGSAYEFNPTNDYNFKMFRKGSDFTDDTICTMAVADAILKNRDFGESLHEWCRKYPNPKGGYGGRFATWVQSENPKPYNSLGNGSAMRVSPVAWAKLNAIEAVGMAAQSATCTHNHPEGIKGAEAVALAIHYGDELRRLSNNISKETILEKFERILSYTGYNINIRKEDVINKFDETCPGTVPVALWIISESTGFEDAIRKAVSLGADADTLGAIVGSIAEAIWGVPTELALKAMNYLPSEMKGVILKFYRKYCWDICPIKDYGDEGVAEDLTKEEDTEESEWLQHAKTIMLWKLGLGHMGKYFNGEDPMPSKRVKATVTSWDVEAMPDTDISIVPVYYEISKEKMDTIMQGHIPDSQEDHWFMYSERNFIRYYRSWTGMCCFIAHFYQKDENYIIDSITINQRLIEFGVNGDEPGKMLFFYLISSETDGFNHELWEAYLDSWEKQHYLNIEIAKKNEAEETAKAKEEERQRIEAQRKKVKEEKLRYRLKVAEESFQYMTCTIAGTKYIKDQSIFYKFEENDILMLKHEKDNKYDDNAIAVYFNDNKVGYIPKKQNSDLAMFFRAGFEKLFFAWVRSWKGCGDKRQIEIIVCMRPLSGSRLKVNYDELINPFGYDKEVFEAYKKTEEEQLYYSTGGITGTLTGRTTPKKIYTLEKNEVFVFGSNKLGHHMGGAAKAAMNNFGAIWGQGDGLQGQSYAINTMDGLLETAKNVNRFILFAAEHQDLKFFVTALGCGIAGYTPLQIAPLFRKALSVPNIFLPHSFWEYFWITEEIGYEGFTHNEDWKVWESKK